MTGVNATPRRKIHRPFGLVISVMLFILFALFGALRISGAIMYGEWLARFDLPVSTLYLLISGIIWLLAGLAAATWTWFQFKHAGWIVRIASLSIGLSYWLDRLLFTRSPVTKSNLPFAVGLTILLALAAAWLSIWLEHQTKQA